MSKFIKLGNSLVNVNNICSITKTTNGGLIRNPYYSIGIVLAEQKPIDLFFGNGNSGGSKTIEYDFWDINERNRQYKLLVSMVADDVKTFK